MKTITGKEVVISMLELATDIARWNKKYTTKATLVKKMDELGLTAHQFEILGFMYANPEFDTVSHLSAELFISKGSLSLMLSKLQAAGFVEKKSAKIGDDGRKVYINLTKKGKKAVDEIRKTVVSNAAEVFEDMDESSKTLFYTKVKELQELFNAGGWKE